MSKTNLQNSQQSGYKKDSERYAKQLNRFKKCEECGVKHLHSFCPRCAHPQS